MAAITKINMLVEKYIKGSQRMILFSKNYDEAYQEALSIVLDEFGYQQDDIDIKVRKDLEHTVEFYYKEFIKSVHDTVRKEDYTILAKMKKEGNSYTITVITG